MYSTFYRLLIIISSLFFLVMAVLSILQGGKSLIGANQYLFYLIITLFMIDIFIGLLLNEFKIHFFVYDALLISIMFLLFIYPEICVFFLHGNAPDLLIALLIIIRYVYMFFINKQENSTYDLAKIFFQNPAKTIISGYVILIFSGTFLLTMPFSHIKNLGYINALFTATSAITVTGLSITKIGSTFTLLGQIIILAMIQIGGIGIMIFSTLISFLLYHRITQEDTVLLAGVFEEKDMKTLAKRVKQIVITTFAIETIVALLILPVFWTTQNNTTLAVFYAIFHAISAFCNAGLALMPDSLMSYANSSYLLLIFGFLVLFWGLGFSTIANITGYIKQKIMGKKENENAIKITENSKLVIFISLVLTLLGFFGFYALEHGNSLRTLTFFKQYLIAFFQTATLRSVGFTTIEVTTFRMPTLILMMLLMYIGGASGSTAGGIRVNTFGVALIRFRAFLRNDPKNIIFGKTVARDLIVRAFMIIFISMGVLFLGLFILSITETHASLIELMFETISAFGNVGLSLGLTEKLTMTSKLVLIVLMLIGKTGPLTLFSSVAIKKKPSVIRYPDAELIIG